MVRSRNFMQIRRRRVVPVFIGVVVMLMAGSVWAQRASRPRGVGLMGSIPGESLFCVRVNRLEDTLGTVNEYLTGIAPESFDVKAMVFSKLGGLLGDKELGGINRRGNVALFAVNVPGESASQNPMSSLFMGALLPVRDYDNFISGNPNFSQPDDEGISTITVDGRTRGLATQFRRFALLCPPNVREKLPQVKKMMAERSQSLVRSLDDNERNLASNSSVWLYLNVKQGASLVKPMLFGKLEQMKTDLQRIKESGQTPMMIDPSGIVDFYRGIFTMLFEGTDHVAIGLSPTSEALEVTFSLKPIPNTEMAAIVGRELEGGFDPMLGYLEDGAMMSLASKVDRESWSAAYMELFELTGKMIPGGIPEADLEQLRELTTKGVNALGDTLAMSAGVNPDGSPMFWGKYIFEVGDRETFEQVIEEEMRMMKEGVFNKLYQGFGMEMDVQVESNAGTYEGIGIASARVTFKISEDESMQARMLARMFGDGLEYRWAFVDGHCVYVVGSDVDKMIRELINQVRAGAPKEIASEMKEALDAVDDGEEADVVGTFNYVRMLNMAVGFMVSSGESETTKINIPTKSNIAFAGRTTDGIAIFQVVLPKAHLQEIKSAFEKVIPEIQKQAKQRK